MSKRSKPSSKSITTFAFVAVILLLIVIVTDIQGGKKAYGKSSSAMGASVFLTLYGGDEKVADAMIEAVKHLDSDCLSPTIQGSDVFNLNANSGQPLKVNAETADVLKKAVEISKKSDFTLNIALGQLIRLWGIDGDNPRVPSAEEIEAALNTADMSRIFIDGNTASIGAGQLIDLGAVGKGAACDIAAETAKRLGVKAASISVGGSVTFVGQKSVSGLKSLFGGSELLWSVGIRDPFGSVNDTFASVKVGPVSISTSGNYEKYFEENGVRYHHIFDPKTGYPSDSGLVSVTVFSDSGLLSDALSTVAFVLGYEKSLPILKEYSAEAVFVFPDKTVRVTDGIKESITITDSEFTLI